jgi:hypothetical protein
MPPASRRKRQETTSQHRLVGQQKGLWEDAPTVEYACPYCERTIVVWSTALDGMPRRLRNPYGRYDETRRLIDQSTEGHRYELVCRKQCQAPRTFWKEELNVGVLVAQRLGRRRLYIGRDL